MSPGRPRLFTISPATPFLEVLADSILGGFPLTGEATLPFSDWSVFLPTRRAAREFSRIFVQKAGRRAIFLPKVRAIGDLDEDLGLDISAEDDPSSSISQNGLLLVLQELISHWASQNPDLELARNIGVSASQRLGLALSLRNLLHQLDTQEIDLVNLPKAYDLELSEHREAILGLLVLVHRELPSKLAGLQKTTFATWRNQALRQEAQRIALGTPTKPVIAAGSTGTIPATRALLLAIAQHPMGAVILPGLDQSLDDLSWENLPPEHSQFSMKHMIDEFGVKRVQIQNLGGRDSSKEFLQAELLRPTATAEQWSQTLPKNAEQLRTATQNIKLIEARERHLEARSIALIMRGTLETSSDKTVELVTPDRDLAARVKNELSRWDISIDDSAGQPLSKFGIAAACHALGQAILNDFDPTSLFDFLRHPNVSIEIFKDDKERVLNNFEIAVLRSNSLGEGLGGIIHTLRRAREAWKKGERLHPLVTALDESSWAEMENLIQFLLEVLSPLQETHIAPFSICLEKFMTALKIMCPRRDETSPENIAFAELENQLSADSIYAPPCQMHGFLVNLLHILETTAYRPLLKTHPRLSILGTLEARLLPADIIILGGLNEGVWPAEPDPGPWLNRPMRGILNLAQPEREIGLAAHDFAQGLAYPEVYLTWSKRISGTPKNPSRWILRLKNLFKAAGLGDGQCEDRSWARYAELLDEATMSPAKKPRASPPPSTRPTKFSVTEIENLLRDPYGVYAKRILNLEPLDSRANKSDPRLRGTLFHAAIADWTTHQGVQASPESLQHLLEAGRKAMLPLMNDPEVASFWMPAFERMAIWLAATDQQLRENVEHLVSEVSGKITFEIGKIPHTLTARADRIDILSKDTARIIDYKTGEAPTIPQVNSGFSPQLLLEAAMVKAGGFSGLTPKSVSELVYIKLSAGRIPGELIPILFGQASIDEKAQLQLDGLKDHLKNYQLAETAYVPRRAPKTEMQVLSYDHLSRFAEWILAEE